MRGSERRIRCRSSSSHPSRPPRRPSSRERSRRAANLVARPCGPHDWHQRLRHVPCLDVQREVAAVLEVVAGRKALLRPTRQIAPVWDKGGAGVGAARARVLARQAEDAASGAEQRGEDDEAHRTTRPRRRSAIDREGARRDAVVGRHVVVDGVVARRSVRASIFMIPSGWFPSAMHESGRTLRGSVRPGSAQR